MNRNHDPCPALETLERRSMVEFRALGDEANPYIVTGYAATFDPFVLYSFDGVDYKERILPDAFSMADMSDVIFQFDHQGRVYARTSNKTLEVTPDDHGLKIRADLSSTESAKAVFEEIRTGLITKMSFSFRVAKDRYEEETHTRVIERIKKVFDVSAVSQPANAGTEIGVSARDYFAGILSAQKRNAQEAALALRRRRMALRTKAI